MILGHIKNILVLSAVINSVTWCIINVNSTKRIVLRRLVRVTTAVLPRGLSGLLDVTKILTFDVQSFAFFVRRDLPARRWLILKDTFVLRLRFHPDTNWFVCKFNAILTGWDPNSMIIDPSLSLLLLCCCVNLRGAQFVGKSCPAASI
jgi:hypothetical protein